MLGPCLRAKNAVEHEADGDNNDNWCTKNSPQGLGKGTWGSGNQRKTRDHTDQRIAEID